MGQKNKQRDIESTDSNEPVDELENVGNLSEEVILPKRVRLLKNFTYTHPHGNGCQLITIPAGKLIIDPEIIKILVEHGADLEE